LKLLGVCAALACLFPAPARSERGALSFGLSLGAGLQNSPLSMDVSGQVPPHGLGAQAAFSVGYAKSHALVLALRCRQGFSRARALEGALVGSERGRYLERIATLACLAGARRYLMGLLYRPFLGLAAGAQLLTHRAQDLLLEQGGKVFSFGQNLPNRQQLFPSLEATLGLARSGDRLSTELRLAAGLLLSRPPLSTYLLLELGIAWSFYP